MRKSYRRAAETESGGILGTTGIDYYNSFLDRILTEGPKAGIGVLQNDEASLFLLAVIAKSAIDMRITTKRIFRMLSLQNTFGVTYGADVALQTNSETTQIDFVRGRHKNLPNNTNIKVPYRPIQTLIIKNLSNSASLKYGMNPFENNLTNTDNTLGPEEQITVETRVPSIRRLNIIAYTGAAVARIILII